MEIVYLANKSLKKIENCEKTEKFLNKIRTITPDKILLLSLTPLLTIGFIGIFLLTFNLINNNSIFFIRYSFIFSLFCPIVALIGSLFICYVDSRNTKIKKSIKLKKEQAEDILYYYENSDKFENYHKIINFLSDFVKENYNKKTINLDECPLYIDIKNQIHEYKNNQYKKEIRLWIKEEFEKMDMFNDDEIDENINVFVKEVIENKDELYSIDKIKNIFNQKYKYKLISRKINNLFKGKQ